MEKKSLYIMRDTDGVKGFFPSSSEKAVIGTYTYEAQRMGAAPAINATLIHPRCLDKEWTRKEYVELQGEKFYVKQTPSSSKDNTDQRYKHEITFVSEREVLDNIYFLDVVTENTDFQYQDRYRSNNTSVRFYGDIKEFVARLNDSLLYSKLYDKETNSGYRIVIDEGVSSDVKEVSIEDKFISEAIQEIYNIFELPYYWVGKTCHIGYSENIISTPLEYGDENALLSIQKSNTNSRIINKITGHGGNTNLPYYYPNKNAEGDAIFNVLNGDKSIVENISLKKIMSYNSAPYTSYALFSMGNDMSYVYGNAPFYIDGILGEFENYNVATLQIGGKVSWIFRYKIYGLKGCYLRYDRQLIGFETESDYDYPRYTTLEKLYISPWKGENADLNEEYRIKYETGAYHDYYFPSDGWYDFTIYAYISYDKGDDEGSLLHVKLNLLASLRYYYNKLGMYFSYGDGQEILVDESGINIDTTSIHNYSHIAANFTDGKWERYELSHEDNPFTVVITGRSWITPSQNLMPSIYRESGGAERFYNAINDTYDNGEGGKYSFNNLYSEASPREGMTAFEDIVPTIKGIKNTKGQLLGEIAAIQYDSDDNDLLKDNSDNEYLHSYFYIKLHIFDGEGGFSLFEHALESDEAAIEMTSGNCAACRFIIGVDKTGNGDGTAYIFHNPVATDDNGNLKKVSSSSDANYLGDYIPTSRTSDDYIERQQDTSKYEVWIAVKKETDTFGVLMPNASQGYRPSVGDTFVITGISLPESYITEAEKRLDAALIAYMKENNDEKFTFSIKFSRIFLAENAAFASKLNENALLNIRYDGNNLPLYVNSYTCKADDNILYEINVELSDTSAISQSELKRQFISLEEKNIELTKYVKNTTSTKKVAAGDGMMVETRLEAPQTFNIVSANEGIIVNKENIELNTVDDLETENSVRPLSALQGKKIWDALTSLSEAVDDIKSFWRFDPDNPDTIYSEYNAYVKGSLSALGLSEGGGGGSAYDLLQDWDKYVEADGKATALSAYLGKDLLDRLAVLEGARRGHAITVTGAGGVLTGVSESADGSTLTFTRGDVDLSAYATRQWVEAKGYATVAQLDGRIDDLVNGAPAAYDTLKEIADVLQGNVDSIGDIITALGTKADKARRITAGAGLTGGGDLSANRTLALAAVGTAGTYTKVTTDAYGRVTAGTTLSAADIPTLAISKISGLQAALDSKLNAADFAQYFAEQMAQWFVRDTGNKALRPADYGGEAYGLYSNAFVSALGVSQGGASGGGSVDILQDWAEYTDEKATWALSAKLGYELYEDVTSLKNGSALNFTTTGSGNVVSAITKSGTTVTVNKGITALTSHQSIYALTIQGNGTTIGTFNPKSAAATINITPANIGAPTKTGSGASGTWGISISGNASTATKLQTARQINGTNFDGSANITTAKWGTARTIYIRDASQAHTGTAVSVDGSANEYLLLPSTIAAALDGNATSATKLQTARTLWGQSFNGTANVSGDMTGVGAISMSGLLTANGGILVPSSKTLKIGSGTISWDTANNMFHFSHGLYSDGAVSALGVGSASGGGGGGSVDILQDWAQYDAGTAKSTALSAYLGYEMRQELQSTVGNIGNTPDYVCTLDLSDIDLDFRRLQQAVLGTRPMFYIVTDNSVGNYVVGTMCMFSDNSYHVLTQVLTTHFLVQDGVFSAHVDSKVYTYYRSYNFGAPGLEGPTRQWTEWREAYGLTGEGSFMGVATPSTAAPSLAYGEEAYYVAATAGTYANLGGLTVASGEVALIRAAYSPGDPSTSFSKTTLSKAGGAVTIASITDLHSSWDSVLKAQKPSWLTSVSIATISDLNSGWDALLKAAPAAATSSKMGFMSASDKDVVNRLTTLLHDHAIMYSSPELTGYWGNASYGEIYIPVFGYYDGAWNESTTTIRLPRVSTSNIGLMTADDKKRLDALIDAITGTGKGFVNGVLSIDKTATSISLNYDLFRYTGSDFENGGYGIALPSATTSLAGLMSAADKAKLDSISSGGLESVSIADITDLHSSWDALLKAAPSSHITRWPTFSEVSSKPTTLSGYGITDGVNAVSVGGSGNAVTAASISGHTLTLTKGSTFLLSSAYTAADVLAKLKTVDGSGSGLDADTLDGWQASKFPMLNGIAGSGTDWNDLLRAGYYKIQGGSNSLVNHPSGEYQYGMAAVLTTENHNDGENRELQLYFPHHPKNHIGMWIRMHNSSTQGNGWKDWVGVPTTNGTIANADKLDGVHLGGLLTSLSSSSGTNLSLTVGGVTKTVADLYATAAEKLLTARAINGTSFNGTADITTAKWGTARTIKIGNTGKSVNGSANVTWTLAEIGSASISEAVGASDAVPEGMTISRAASSFGLTLKTIGGGDLDELSLPMATTSLAGLMSASDKSKLNSALTSVSLSTISDLNSGWDSVLKAEPDGLMDARDWYTLNALGNTAHAGAINLTIGSTYIDIAFTSLVGEKYVPRLPAATTTAAGLMSASDKTKLNSALTSVSLATISDLNSSWDALLKAAPAAATASKMGFMSASDKAKMTEFSNALYNLETMGLLKNDGNGYLERLSSVTQSTNSITINFVAQHLTSAGVPQSGYSIVTLPAASTTKAGLMSATDFVLLQGLSHAASSGGGNGILHAPLTTSRTSTSVSINYTVSQYDGSAFKEVDFNLPIPAATTSLPGLMSAADKSKLNYLYGAGGGVSWSSISGWFVNNTSATVNAQKIMKVDSYFDLYAIRIEDTEHQVYHITEGTDAGPLIAVCGSYQTTGGDYIAMFTVVLPNTTRRPYATRYVINY